MCLALAEIVTENIFICNYYIDCKFFFTKFLLKPKLMKLFSSVMRNFQMSIAIDRPTTRWMTMIVIVVIIVWLLAVDMYHSVSRDNISLIIEYRLLLLLLMVVLLLRYVICMTLQHRMIPNRSKHKPFFIIVFTKNFILAQIESIAHAESANTKSMCLK